jgi:hypothetical protein
VRLRRRDPGDLSRLSERELRRPYRDVGRSGDGSAEGLTRAGPADAQFFSQRALDLLTVEDRVGTAEAWNLGIAATAQRDWPVARTA